MRRGLALAVLLLVACGAPPACATIYIAVKMPLGVLIASDGQEALRDGALPRRSCKLRRLDNRTMIAMAGVLGTVDYATGQTDFSIGDAVRPT